MESYLDNIKYIKIGHYLFYKSLYEKSEPELTNYYFFSFAVTCYHLKDWLENDNIFTKEEVQDHIDANIRLKNLGVVANSYKHFKLSGRHWENIGLIRGNRNFSYKDPAPIFKIEDTANDKESSITINTPHKSLHSWNKLFRDKGLPQPFQDYS